jgi:rhodanese-related sulfurtransferase
VGAFRAQAGALTLNNGARHEHDLSGGLLLFSRSKSLTASEAAAALARGELQLIDVRELSEVSEARVKGARHIPLGQLHAKLGELDRPVAFLCRSGSRSAIATRTATKAGLDAANVKGGVIAWERAGLPLGARRRRGAR